MKKKEMTRLALFGIATGVLMASQSGIEALENSHAINMDYVLAKPSCKAHGGCGGTLTATRDFDDKAKQDLDDEDVENNEDLPNIQEAKVNQTKND